jgi:RHS repeat-associated protein
VTPDLTVKFLAFSILAMALFQERLLAQTGNDNPTGISGAFNGNITTAGSYDPYTGNATRSVTDIVVAGSVGAYPLAFTRTMNTRYTPGMAVELGEAGSWRHSYQWSIDSITMQSNAPNKWSVMSGFYTVNYPDGRRLFFSSADVGLTMRSSPGVSDRFQKPVSDGDNCYVLLPDGGKIWFTVQIQRTGDDSGPVTSTFDFQFMGIIDPYGLVTTITYPGDGSMKITEPAGRWLKLWYTTTPWMGDTVMVGLQASDGRGISYNYGPYQPAGGATYSFLANVQYRDTNGAVYATATYGYQPGNIDPNGRPLISSCIDPMFGGPMWAINYTFVPESSGGVYGKLQSENYRDPTTGSNGAAVSTLSISGDSRTETRRDGPSRVFNYSGGKLGNYTDFKGQSSSISYDSSGYVSAFTDARTNTTFTSREPRIGALSVVTHPGDNSTASFGYTDANNPYYLSYRTDERGNTTSFTRNSNHQVQRIDYPDGAFETFTYNNFNQVASHRLKPPSLSTPGGLETFVYDSAGKLMEYRDPYHPAAVDPQHPEIPATVLPSMSYGYDALGRTASTTDALNHTTSYQYSARGQTIKVTHPDTTYAQSGYNDNGTLAWTADENHPNAATDSSQRTRYGYDDYKRFSSVTNLLNQTTTVSYAPWNGSGSYSHTSVSVYRATSPMLKLTDFNYDENFRRTALRKGSGSPDDDGGAYFGYDEVGNLVGILDPRGNVTTFGYDNRNRRTSATNPAPFNNEITRWEYDAVGNLTKETRPDLLFRTTGYDLLNRVIDTHGFADEHTHYDRDLAGNVWQIIDPKGAVYGFQYDALNRKIHETYPADAFGASRFRHCWYDVVGNLNQSTNPLNQYQFFTYDNRNRLTSSSWNWGGPSIAWNYDDASRLTSVVTNGGETTVAFGYDAANHKITEDQTFSGSTHRVQTNWDADGNRSGLGVPGLYGFYFDYTQRNQLANIYGGDWGHLFHYTYDANGNMTDRQGQWFSNGTSLSYDALNRITDNVQIAPNWNGHSHHQYDSLSREVATWRQEQSNKGERFGYDAMGQLTSVAYNADNVWDNPVNASRTVSYNVDALNRQSVTENGTVTGYSPNAMNQYTSVGGQAVGYDENFNITSHNGVSFTYDAQNRLVGGSMQCIYDGLGRCVRRTINGVTRLFVYDGWNPIVEFDGAGQPQAWNLYGSRPDEILIRSLDFWNSRIWYHSDKRGNVSALMNDSGNVVEKYTYDAFGQPTILSTNNTQLATSAYGNRFMFRGREWISELGIYDYRNRFYHPGLGRFLQSDPMGFAAGDANLFRYCGGDPVNGRDPFGLKTEPETKKKDGNDSGYATTAGVVVDAPYDWSQGSWIDASSPQGMLGFPNLGSSPGAGFDWFGGTAFTFGNNGRSPISFLPTPTFPPQSLSPPPTPAATGFNTPAEAARDVANLFPNPQREEAGAIFQEANQLYGYTNPMDPRNTEHASAPGGAPAGTVLVGIWHLHLSNLNFSSTDLYYANYYQINSFVILPNGGILMYNPTFGVQPAIIEIRPPTR